ncbi:hypothetical protein MNBD_DELTA04-1621 [hydrothermal vent metagenome]|uniref:Uncharacterized protein n=1 Tax=hydrothermal vent metagenome TaxID=652676 RepID=A0A3B0VCV5_9ZZZZ
MTSKLDFICFYLAAQGHELGQDCLTRFLIVTKASANVTIRQGNQLVEKKRQLELYSRQESDNVLVIFG